MLCTGVCTVCSRVVTVGMLLRITHVYLKSQIAAAPCADAKSILSGGFIGISACRYRSKTICDAVRSCAQVCACVLHTIRTVRRIAFYRHRKHSRGMCRTCTAQIQSVTLFRTAVTDLQRMFLVLSRPNSVCILFFFIVRSCLLLFVFYLFS